jgi:hypothetical protein
MGFSKIFIEREQRIGNRGLGDMGMTNNSPFPQDIKDLSKLDNSTLKIARI